MLHPYLCCNSVWIVRNKSKTTCKLAGFSTEKDAQQSIMYDWYNKVNDKLKIDVMIFIAHNVEATDH